MWVLERPAYLLLFLVMPVLVYMRHFSIERGGRLPLPFTMWDGPRFRPPFTGRGTLLRLSALLFWSACVMLVVALAGPTRTTRERILLSRGVDIVIVLDQSASMGAQDFRPVNRFETARNVIQRFVDQRTHDHIGLVGFSAEAALRVPPTLNHTHVLQELASMQLMELGDGTAIGMGLALAALHLRGSDAEEQAIILITDGVNNAGEISPAAAAEVAGEVGIRIYAIGVGSGQEARIEVRDPETGQLYRGTVRDSYDEATLERIAELSGGSYFAAGSAGTLETIFDAIGSAESTERRTRVQVRRQPQHQLLLIIAALLLMVDVLLRRVVVGITP